ncbi:conjugal transfer protein TraN [Ferrovum myxofaciens]|uniref:Conjugal transfer protein TraN n=1 Tax=Ferrovum myxofaciens TaxID=416213 RepID=A0A9E6SY32_9PROT|nr:MAG: conjugal transfer protein TraN [Ferrovum myxofaciens]
MFFQIKRIFIIFILAVMVLEQSAWAGSCTTGESVVEMYYIGYFGRSAGVSGLNYWEGQSIPALNAGFSSSSEFANTYAGMTLTQKINQVYMNELGRNADSGGSVYWSGQINSGALTFGGFIRALYSAVLNGSPSSSDYINAQNIITNAVNATNAIPTSGTFSCAQFAGQYGIPPTDTVGTGTYYYNNSCTSYSQGPNYAGGCSAPCTETPGTASCSTLAGQDGIPSTNTAGTASYTTNSCTGQVTYTGGCSVPCTETPGTASCSILAGQDGIPSTNTAGTASYTTNSCTGQVTYTGGCSVPVASSSSCTTNSGTASCSTLAGQDGIPSTNTAGTASYTQNSCTGVVTYTGGCSAPTASGSGSCTLTGSTCLDSTSCKTINGATVCLAGIAPPPGGFNVPQSCWNESQNYNCNDTAVDTCGTVVPSTCSINSSTCSQTDPVTGACSVYTRSYTCQAITGAPTAVNACAGSMPSTYVQTGQTCIQSDVYPMVYNSPIWGPLEATAAGSIASAPGISVPASSLVPNPNYGTCLTYSDVYAGSSPSSTNQSCTPIPAENLGGCSGGAQTCIATNANGLCTTYSQNQTCNITSTYQTRTPITATNGTGTDCNNMPAGCVLKAENCLDSPPSPISSCKTIEKVFNCPTSTSPSTTSCSNALCLGANCYGKSDAANTAFASAATTMEMARQMGANFNQASMTIFYGEAHDCSDTLGGLFGNCCQVKSSPPKSGSDMQAMVEIAAQTGLNSLVTTYGSSYVFNTLLSSSSFASDAFASLGGSGVASASFEGMVATVGPGGIAFSVSPAALAAGIGILSNMALMAGAITPAENLAVQVAADYAAYYMAAMGPYGLALAVAEAVMSYLATCSNEENQLALIRGKNMCYQVGSYCSMSVPLLGICLQTKTSFCCFNSKLALLINEQGRPQIGKSWGAPQSPDCSGFTIPQIDSLNFAAMNLTAAFSDFTNNATLPNAATLSSQISSKLTSSFSSNISTGSSATPSQIQSFGSNIASPAQLTAGYVGPMPPSTAGKPNYACIATWGAQVPDTLTPPDYTSSINITSCVPGATLDMYYTSQCSALITNPPLHFAFDGSGSASVPVYMPASCLPSPATATTPALAGSANIWGGAVNTSTGGLSQHVSITW